MKLHKGKLSPSNAIVIGVLVVVLYLVMPGGSQKKRSENTDQSATEAPIVTSSTPGPSVDSKALSDQEQKPSSPASPMEIVSPESTTVRIRPLLEIDEEKLQEIVGRNPFCTSVVMVRSEKSSESETPDNAIVGSGSDETIPATDLVSKSTVKLFYSSSTGRQAAVLNDDIVYQGTSVSEKLTVDSIHPDGVRIRRSTPGTTTEK
jgi:hypothetical protein